MWRMSAIMTEFREPDVFVGGGHFNDALLFVRVAKELNFSPKGNGDHGRSFQP